MTGCPRAYSHVALKSDMPVPTSALTINRLCGSGFQSCVELAVENHAQIHTCIHTCMHAACMHACTRIHPCACMHTGA